MQTAHTAKTASPTPVAASPAPVAASRPLWVLATVNPKKPGSLAAARYALYAANSTVQQYVAACIALGQPNAQRNATADIAWDVKHGFISLTPPAA